MAGDWTTHLHRLILELEGAERKYGELAEMESYRDKHLYFRKQQLQRLKFSRILRDELQVVTVTERSMIPTEPLIFEKIETKNKKGLVGLHQLENQLIDKERNLVEGYQHLLGDDGVSYLGDALLQSQVEEINNGLEGLKLDYRLKRVV